MTNTRHLRELAEAAGGKGTPRWRVRAGNELWVYEVEPGPDDFHEASQPVAEASSPEESAYIAAAGPATVLRLLDERDRALERLDIARDLLLPQADPDNPELTQEGNQALGQVCAAIAELRGEGHDIPAPRKVRLRHPEGDSDEQPF